MRAIIIFFFLLFPFVKQAQNSVFNSDLLFAGDQVENKSRVFTFLVSTKNQNFSQQAQKFKCRVNYGRGEIYSISCDLETIKLLAENHIISRAELTIPRIQPMNDTMLKRNRILPVHQGQSPLQQAYDGTGVILGFIDTGIDFNHPDFKDQSGKSRIMYLWDQNQNTGPLVPQPYNYGIEWSKTDIDASICTHSDVAFWGHGTHVTGIGAGNGLATNSHFGAAPNTSIIAVALNFNLSGPTIADGVSYIFSKAVAAGKTCVINISVGDYYGSHDATDLSSKLIDNEIKAMNGRAVIAAAGNAGGVRFHVKSQPPVGDTVFTWFRENTSLITYYFYGDSAQVSNLRFSFGANRNNFSNLGNIGFKNSTYCLNTIQSDTIKNNGNRIGIVKTAATINADKVYELEAQILPDTANLNWRVETTGQGLHHSWNFSFVGTGLPSVSQHPRMTKYVAPDTLYTMVSGFQCSEEVITVGNYNNVQYYYDVQDSLRMVPEPAGMISRGSSIGPTRDNRQKPDIAASGQVIFSAGVLSLLPGLITNQPKDVAQDSMHVGGGGTSAASPIVAGLAALYFQKNPNADHRMLKQAITSCAYQDAFTGNNLPNSQWGYGKLDGKNTLLCGENLAGIKNEGQSNGISIYPNPFSEEVRIIFTETKNRIIQVYDARGMLLLNTSNDSKEYNLSGVTLQNTKGLIFVRIIDSFKSDTFKLVKN